MSGLDACLMLAADLNPLAPGVGFSKTGGLVLRDLLLILGSALLLGTLLIFWAVNRSRRAKSSRHRHHHRHASSTNANAAPRTPDANEHQGYPSPTASVPADREHHHRRRRRRRRDHRSRNPTLAQTGGLPPRRSQPLPPPVP